jgi:hypothetical protein
MLLCCGGGCGGGVAHRMPTTMAIMHVPRCSKIKSTTNTLCFVANYFASAVFKDNTLYSPNKPEVLAAEIEILRT